MKTKIEWTDATWNPLRGCSRVSDGCRNCYAEKVANRFSGPGQPYEGLIAKGGQWNGKIKLVPEKLSEPLRWKKPRMVFVNSMSDLFHESVPDDFIDKVFAIMAQCPEHTFQILTKRPKRMLSYLSAKNLGRRVNSYLPSTVNYPIPPKNVWLGVSVEDQKSADERIPLLLRCPAAVRWVSAEPLLGPVNLTFEDRPVDWVVVGGESGHGARPMAHSWARSLRDQCVSAGVPFFMKQMGGRAKKTMAGIPEDLMIREYP